MIQSAVNLTATDDVTTGPTKLYAINNGTTAGTVVLRDGGASGTIKATFPVAAGQHINLIPLGMRFPNGLHATLTTTNNISFWVG